MDKTPDFKQKKATKPSLVLAMVALIVACLLPLYLVKTFRHKSTDQINMSGTLAPTSQTDDNTADEFEDDVLYSQLSTPPNELIQQETDKVSTSDKSSWEVITAKEGDTLASLFKRLGLSSKTLQAVMLNNPHANILSHIKPGQEVRFWLDKKQLLQLIIPLSTTASIEVTYQDNQYRTKMITIQQSIQNNYLTATVKGSLYGTAKRLKIPFKLMQQMVDIFNWEINFAKDVREGDQFTIIYEGIYVENKLVGTGDILAVSYTSRHKTHQAIRHQSAKGDINYYTPQGASLKKAFTRYPLKFSHISSTFSLKRMHPKLHYRRPHKGVDLAAPIGTPIYAIGDGKIVTIGSNNGYGNMIKIVHNKTYSSIYAHMLKFQKGLAKGSRVKRGQVIGYVGQTGLATGPHCHFEFHINNQARNPTTVDLPRADSIPPKELAQFKTQAGTLLAQISLVESAHLASKDPAKHSSSKST